jgi:uncharacterized protein YeaO (DUF488 family)
MDGYTYGNSGILKRLSCGNLFDKNMILIKTKKIYERTDPDDGLRILVDRVWPHGISKQKAKIDMWVKDVAPSSLLGLWFGHDPTKWEEFRRIYWKELDNYHSAIRLLYGKINDSPITFIFSSEDNEFNNAVALKEYIEREIGLLSFYN